MPNHNVCRRNYSNLEEYTFSVENAHLPSSTNLIEGLEIPSNFDVMEVDEECSELIENILGEDGISLHILDVSAENMGGEWDGRACPLVNYGFRTLGSMTSKDIVAAPKNSAPSVIENIQHFIDIGIMDPNNVPRILIYEPLEGKLMVEAVAKSIQKQAFSLINVQNKKTNFKETDKKGNQTEREFDEEFEISSSKIFKKKNNKLIANSNIPNTTTKSLKRIIEFINVPAFQKLQKMLKEKFEVEAFLGSNPDSY